MQQTSSIYTSVGIVNTFMQPEVHLFHIQRHVLSIKNGTSDESELLKLRLFLNAVCYHLTYTWCC